MARFARIISGFPNSTPFCESRFGAPKIVNRRFEAIRANRSNVMKTGFCLRIDSRCESLGHLRRCVRVQGRGREVWMGVATSIKKADRAELLVADLQTL